MFTETFTIFGSSLSLLKPGEQGIVNRVESADEATVQKLREMGIVPGVTIAVVERSPAYTIVVGGDRLILNQKSADAVYVRLTIVRSNSVPSAIGNITKWLTALSDLRQNTQRTEFAATQSKSTCVD